MSCMICMLRYMTSTITSPRAATLAHDEALGLAVNQHLFAGRKTHDDLAKMLNLSQSTISRKVRGRVPWTAQEVSLTAAFFGLQVQDLMPSWQPGDGEGAGTWVPAPFVPGLSHLGESNSGPIHYE